jgi:SET domain-containing protein|tara:strand:- start:538 stop:1005 length:468 start_codon:yes stop_codon:yes gene_type:complete
MGCNKFNLNMYRPLPKQLTIKNSPIEGLGLFATTNIKSNSFIGVTHIRDEQFENKYIRTPLGGFYNHSNNPTVIRMVSNILPTLNFGDPIDTKAKAKRFDENDTNRENMYYNLSEKPDAKYMFMVSIKDIKPGEELTANYNLYTYPKTGVGIQML